MNISVFGFSISVEVLILIGIIYLILVVNTLTSCCNIPGMLEGFEQNGLTGGVDTLVKDVASQAKTITEGYDVARKLTRQARSRIYG